MDVDREILRKAIPDPKRELRRPRQPLSLDHVEIAAAWNVARFDANAIRSLELSPFSFRKATPSNPFLREGVIPFGVAEYVALFEIDNDTTVTVLAGEWEFQTHFLTRVADALGV